MHTAPFAVIANVIEHTLKAAGADTCAGGEWGGSWPNFQKKIISALVL